jgi:hypothetical protein
VDVAHCPLTISLLSSIVEHGKSVCHKRKLILLFSHVL